MSATSSQAAGGSEQPPADLFARLLLWEHEHELRAVDIAAAPGGAVNASKQIGSGNFNLLFGWSFTETTGAAVASVRLHDGRDANGAVLARISLTAAAGVREMLPEKGLRLQTGQLWLEVVSGSVEGVLWVR